MHPLHFKCILVSAAWTEGSSFASSVLLVIFFSYKTPNFHNIATQTLNFKDQFIINYT